jgi:hypothetical protein
MRQGTINVTSSKRLRRLGSAAVSAILMTVCGLGVNAEAATSNPTYHACLKTGTLTKVGTSLPTCAAPASAISWNATGPRGASGPAGNVGLPGPRGPAGATTGPSVARLSVNNVKLVPGHTTQVLTVPVALVAGERLVVHSTAFIFLPAAPVVNGTQSLNFDDVQCVTMVDNALVSVSQAGLVTPSGANGLYTHDRMSMSLDGLSATFTVGGNHTVTLLCNIAYGTDTNVQVWAASLTAIASE